MVEAPIRQPFRSLMSEGAIVHDANLAHSVAPRSLRRRLYEQWRDWADSTSYIAIIARLAR